MTCEKICQHVFHRISTFIPSRSHDIVEGMTVEAPEPTPQPGNGSSEATPEQALLARLDRTVVKESIDRPRDVDEALQHASKQSQVWEIKRDEAVLERVKKEPALPGGLQKAINSLEGGFAKVLSESTHFMARFSGATESAKKAWKAYQALKRVALTKPYKAA